MTMFQSNVFGAARRAGPSHCRLHRQPLREKGGSRPMKSSACALMVAILAATLAPAAAEDSGFVPPDANTGECEDLVAGHLKTLSACMTRCQTRQADAARKGTAF